MKEVNRFFALLVLLFVVMGLCACTAPSEPNAEEGPAVPSGGNLIKGTPIKVSLLFFNDLHGYLEPFKVKDKSGNEVEVGGIARLAAEVKRVRAENEEAGVQTFVLVAGDILQGTPMSTVFEGEPDIKALNMIGVDAMTVGNHEFDFGQDNFLKLKAMAAFPFLSANLFREDSGEALAAPRVSLPLNGGLELTVIGVTTRQLLVTTRAENVRGIEVRDPIERVKATFSDAPKGPVVLLSHSKAITDETIARELPGLAAIIGGHDQVLMNPHKRVGDVAIFQAFEKGRYLGRLDLEVNPRDGKARIVDSGYKAITGDMPPDPDVDALVSSYKARLDDRFDEVIGEALVFLDGERERIRYEETNLGNFVADTMRESTGVDVALINGGAIRSSVNKGPVTLGDLFRAMPYANEIVILELQGSELLLALDRAYSATREDEDGGFLHVSGLRVTVRGKEVALAEFAGSGHEVRPDAAYRVAAPDFIAEGGDGYALFKDKIVYKTGSPLRELIVDVFRSRGKVSAEVDGRFVRVRPPRPIPYPQNENDNMKEPVKLDSTQPHR